MSKKFQINDELAAVEAALSSLEPGTSSVIRDRMMFLAGRASVSILTLSPTRRPTHWLWPATAAASLVLAISFGVMFFFLGSPRIEKQIVYIEVKKPGSNSDAPKKLWYDTVKSETAVANHQKSSPGMDGLDYLTLSRLIVSEGVEGIPNIKSDNAAPDGHSRNHPLTLRDWEEILND